MLTLSLKTQPYWIDLPRGVRVQVLPARASLMEGVREDLFADRADTDEEVAPPSLLTWTKLMAASAIVAWEGVADENGKEIPPSPDYIDALIEDDRIFAAFRDQYVMPALQVAEEGNA